MIDGSDITSSAFWKKENKKLFYYYSLFQQRIKCTLIPYGLYFDSIDDDDDKEHVDDFNAFSPGHSQYLAFSFNGNGNLANLWKT